MPSIPPSSFQRGKVVGNFQVELFNQSYKQFRMMLKLQDRYSEKFLARNSTHSYGLDSCCQFFRPLQKQVIVQQKLNNQQKISLKKVTAQQCQQRYLEKNRVPAPQITRNVKKETVTPHPFLPVHPSTPSRIPYLPPVLLPVTPLLLTCKSQQDLHATTHTIPRKQLQKPTFLFSSSHRNPEQLISTVQSLSRIQITSTKEVQKVDQTTCLEHQSQFSIEQSFPRPLTSTKPGGTGQEGRLEVEVETGPDGEQWSDESLSSETNLRFEQIDEEESISDSASLHKNIVIVNHGSHPQLFDDLRKAHSIRSNLSHASSFSGHSIVLERDHAFFVTPNKRNDRNENRFHGSGDF